jgi:hypothetical protein
MIIKTLRYTTLIICIPFITAFSQTPSPEPVKSNKDLAAENAALKKEIQELRKLLATNSASKDSSQSESTEKESTDSEKVSKSDEVNGEFWLSKSGKRHNPDCRYFKKSEGKTCTKDEGTACGICGG